jgi:hypothetical protein
LALGPLLELVEAVDLWLEKFLACLRVDEAVVQLLLLFTLQILIDLCLFSQTLKDLTFLALSI